jgi:hypothetical protein
MNINEVFLFISYVANKQQSGSISPDEFNVTCKAVTLDLLKNRLGLPEEYQVGNPQPRIAYQITQKITDDLRPFIVKQKVTTNNDGYFPVPTDYAAFSSLKFLYTESKSAKCKKPATNLKEVTMFEYVTDAELSIRLNNTVLKPTYRYPIIGFYSYGIKPYPEDISVAELTYVRYPATPFWGYTMQGDQSVYDPTTSVDVEFPDTMFVDFCIRVLKYLSINIREEMLYDMVQQRQDKGQ